MQLFYLSLLLEKVSKLSISVSWNDYFSDWNYWFWIPGSGLYSITHCETAPYMYKCKAICFRVILNPSSFKSQPSFCYYYLALDCPQMLKYMELLKTVSYSNLILPVQCVSHSDSVQKNWISIKDKIGNFGTLILWVC